MDRTNRRRFLRDAAGIGLSISSLTLVAGCERLSAPAAPPAVGTRPETTTIRLVQGPSMCQAPQYVVEDLMRSEGFTNVQYVPKPGTKQIEAALASGEVDINMHFAAPLAIRVDEGDPVVMLAGGHVGCFELFGTDQVRAIRDLKGKTVAMLELGSSQHVFLSSMLSYVGLDPRVDVTWATFPPAEAIPLLAEGKIDAYLGFPPDPQELRAKQIGHLVVNSSVDRPWSQYFCCMVTGNRAFVQKHPVATKRALRAIMKAADLCERDPDGVARTLVDKGYSKNYEYTRQALRGIPYGKWREYDPEDTVRFYALRLHEVGMIKSSPDKIIAQGTDWRFLNELKQELKG